MPSRTTIIIYARNIASYYVGFQNGAVKSRETLQNIYRDAMEIPLNRTLKNGYGTNLEAIKSGKWLRRNGIPGETSVESEGIAWCGIFATYVLRGCGIPVK